VWEVVPRAWTLVWAVLSGQEVPSRVPREWLERWQGEAPVLLPETVRDRPEDHRAVPRREEIEATNRRTLESLRRQALPLIRGYGLGF
jgi:acetoin utilization protein AcuC